MPDRREEVAAGADRHRHQERVGAQRQLAGHASCDRRHHQDGRGIVEERRQRHGSDQHQPERAKRREVLRRGRQPARDQPRGARRLQRLAHRDEGTEQDQHRPLDGLVRFLERQQLQHQHRYRGTEEADRHRYDAHRDQNHRGPEDRRRQIEVARTAQGYVALGQRQAAERGKLVVDALAAALQHQQIALLEADPAQPLGDPAPGAAHRQQVQAVALAQGKLLHGVADHDRVGGHHRLDDRQVFLGSLVRCKPLAVDQLQPGVIDEP